MSNNGNLVGLFELQTPVDLFRKLEFDLARLEKNRTDQYAAFDFFVTAEHLLDWVYPDERRDRVKRAAERKGSPLLQVCSHLANGAKHFRATATRHTSVGDAKVRHGAFSSDFSDDFDISRLEIHLDGDAAIAFGQVIEVLRLARQVRDFWRMKLGL